MTYRKSKLTDMSSGLAMLSCSIALRSIWIESGGAGSPASQSYNAAFLCLQGHYGYDKFPLRGL
jgi:hypothetical protein